MNKLGKAGGILAIIAAAFGIITSLIFVFIGGIFSSSSAGVILLIIGIAEMVLSIMMIVWSSGYISDGSRKGKLFIFSIIAAVLALCTISFTAMILYIIAAVFIAIGKKA